MSPQERDMLNRFLGQLVEARGYAKDSEADAMIRDAVARQPDAHYLLVQKALLLQQALDHANARINELQASAGSSQSFLGGGFAPPPAQPACTPPPVYQAPYQASPMQRPASPWGGFLGTVATTAAGVAAGDFLFQGIEHLFGGSGFGGGNPVESVTVNNFYDDPTQGGPIDGGFDDGSSWT